MLPSAGTWFLPRRFVVRLPAQAAGGPAARTPDGLGQAGVAGRGRGKSRNIRVVTTVADDAVVVRVTTRPASPGPKAFERIRPRGDRPVSHRASRAFCVV